MLQNGWDDLLAKEFYDVVDEIKSLGQLFIPQCDHLVNLNNAVVSIELHGFNGSKVAYRASVYIKLVTKWEHENILHCHKITPCSSV